jgi:hypothetical protein
MGEHGDRPVPADPDELPVPNKLAAGAYESGGGERPADGEIDRLRVNFAAKERLSEGVAVEEVTGASARTDVPARQPLQVCALVRGVALKPGRAAGVASASEGAVVLPSDFLKSQEPSALRLAVARVQSPGIPGRR